MTTMCCIRPAQLLALDFDQIADPRARNAARAELNELGIVRPAGPLSDTELRALGRAPRHRTDHDTPADTEPADTEPADPQTRDLGDHLAVAYDSAMLETLPPPEVIDDGTQRDVSYVHGLLVPYGLPLPLGRTSDGALVCEQLSPESFRWRASGGRLDIEHALHRVVGHCSFHPGGDGLHIVGTVVADAAEGRAAASLVRSGSLPGLSVEFTPDRRADQLEERDHGRVKIIHRRNGIATGAGLVTYPAFAPHARIHVYANESPAEHRTRIAQLRRNDPRMVKLKTDMDQLHQRTANLHLYDQRRRLRAQLVQAQVRATLAVAGVDPGTRRRR